MLIATLIIGSCVLVIAWMLLTMMYPQSYVKFAKFLVRRINQAAGRPVLTPEQEEAKAKAKKLAPYLAVATKIEQIAPGQSLKFRISREKWCADYLTVELNSQYPRNGKKYILSAEKSVHGMPDFRKTIMNETDNTVEIAESIIAREGNLLVTAEEMPAGAEKVAVGARKQAGSSGTTGII